MTFYQIYENIDNLSREMLIYFATDSGCNLGFGVSIILGTFILKGITSPFFIYS